MGLQPHQERAAWGAPLPLVASLTPARPPGTACVEARAAQRDSMAAATATRAFTAPAKLATRSRRSVTVQVRHERQCARRRHPAAAPAKSAGPQFGAAQPSPLIGVQQQQQRQQIT